MSLPDKSIKLIYGSPPYPNADRNYGNWSSDEYIDKMAPFFDAAKVKLRDDGFLVINVKANREKATKGTSTKRSLVVEKMAILLEERWGFHCVDIEIWVKDNPVPTGLRSACQDAYEQNLWFSVSPKWEINIDAIRRPYDINSLKAYVPERDEGYGLNLQTIENILNDFPIDLLITVDCGISDVDKIKELKNKGIDVIVTDHHEPPEILPDCIKINPKIQGQEYPFNGLCGAGVAYMLGVDR